MFAEKRTQFIIEFLSGETNHNVMSHLAVDFKNGRLAGPDSRCVCPVTNSGFNCSEIHIRHPDIRILVNCWIDFEGPLQSKLRFWVCV